MLAGPSPLPERDCHDRSPFGRLAAELARRTSGATSNTPLLVVDQWDWQADERWQQPHDGATGYVRIGCDGDRLWIGPHFQPASSGCAKCFEMRLQKNHPMRSGWKDMFGHAGELPHPPLAPTAPMLNLSAELIERVLATTHEIPLRYYIVEIDTGLVSAHTFFPDPTCEHCRSIPDDCAESSKLAFRSGLRTSARTFRLENPALTLKAVERLLLDRRSGLVQHVFLDMNSQMMPMVAAEMPLFAEQNPVMAYGRAATVERARLTALLESGERFAGIRPHGKRTAIRSTAKALGDRCVDPELFVLHDPAQAEEPGYEQRVYDPDLEQGWVWAFSCRRCEPVLMPEQLAYYGLRDRPGAPVNRYVHHTSSGCALGHGIEEAVLYGLLELIERDAYLTGWYGQFPFPKLDIADAADPDIHLLAARAAAEGYGLHLFDMTLEFGAPSIWAMIEDPRPNAQVRSYCAAAAHINPERAIASAMDEVITSMAVYRISMPSQRDRAEQLARQPALIQRMDDHVLAFSHPETMNWVKFLPRHEPGIPLRQRFAEWYRRSPTADLTAELQRVVERVLHVAHDVLIVDQTFPGLEQLGLNAVSVAAPGLMPVTFGQQYRRIGFSRIVAAAKHLGLPAPRDADQLNPWPHNFP